MTPDGSRRSQRPTSPLLGLVLMLLAVLTLDHHQDHLSRSPGIDFYQYWAVPTARRVSAEPLGSPYRESERYARVLAAIAETSSDNRLKAVTEYRRDPGFASTPLLYVLGAWLPGDYTLALRIYQGLQFAAFGLALWLLSRAFRLRTLELAVLGLLMVLYYMPVLSELRVLNTNAFLLAALAATISLLTTRDRRVSLPRATSALSLTVLVVFLKPLWAPLPLLVAAHLGWRDGSREIWRPAVGATALGAVLWAWPAAAFGPAVWGDWYRQVFADDPDHLVFAIEEGNRSAPLVLARATGLDLGVVLGLLVALLVLSLGAVLLRTERGAVIDRGSIRRAVAPLLGRPAVALGLGIAAMLALSPLAWWHYYVIALLPTLLLLSPAASGLQAFLAGASLLLASGRLGPVYAWFGDADSWTIYGVALAWLPLWIGLLLPFEDRSNPSLPE